MSEISQTPDEPKADAYALQSEAVDQILACVEDGSQSRLVSLLDPLHAADIADLLEQIKPDERQSLVALWGKNLDGDVLFEVEEGIRDDLIEEVEDDVLASAVADMETDEVVYLVEDMAAPEQEKILDALEDADRVAVEQSLQYPEDSAGRMMQRDLVTAPTHWNVGDAIDHMRAAEDLPDDFYKVIVIDPRMRPVGTVRLSQIMGNARSTALSELMDEDLRTIPVEQAREDVAYAFNQYHLVSAPVVDDDGRLVGVITIDDAMEALEEEAEEDIKRLAGVGGDEELTDSVWETTRARFPWLAVNLFTSIVASIVIGVFSGTIEAIVALAVLMPIVASMGGNAGTQTLTVAVRAIATRDLTPKNMWRIIRRETLVGLANGIVFAIIIGIVGLIWFGMPMLGVVLFLAMIANLLVAGIAGILVPIALDRLGADPALASGAFVTTVTDIVGFFAFLGLAALLMF